MRGCVLKLNLWPYEKAVWALGIIYYHMAMGQKRVPRRTCVSATQPVPCAVAGTGGTLGKTETLSVCQYTKQMIFIWQNENNRKVYK